MVGNGRQFSSDFAARHIRHAGSVKIAWLGALVRRRSTSRDIIQFVVIDFLLIVHWHFESTLSCWKFINSDWKFIWRFKLGESEASNHTHSESYINGQIRVVWIILLQCLIRSLNLNLKKIIHWKTMKSEICIIRFRGVQPIDTEFCDFLEIANALSFINFDVH